MRVIAGSARGVVLLSPKGGKTRPTLDRIKEDIFNIISGEIMGSRFLDLFSGSGAIGIEALSRGANSAVFVEQDKISTELIEKNIKKARVDCYSIIRQDVLTAIKNLDPAFDVVFMDPPYEKGIIDKVLQSIAENGILAKNGLLVIEAGKPETINYSGNYELIKTKMYKITVIYFLKRRENV